jgi:hypothetical protein
VELIIVTSLKGRSCFLLFNIECQSGSIVVLVRAELLIGRCSTFYSSCWLSNDLRSAHKSSHDVVKVARAM